jgi:hypothetical protein
LATTVAGLGLPLVAAGTAHAAGPSFSFGFVGDMPYASDYNAGRMANWAADVNASGISFIAHSGDFKGGSDSCDDTNFNQIHTWYNAANVPVWYTPGDNDWTDCHRNSNGTNVATASNPAAGNATATGSVSYDPLSRLSKVRSIYFDPNPHQTNTGGGTPIALTTQKDSLVGAEQAFEENTLFNKDCVTFGDIHSVTSANGLLTPVQGSVTKSSSSAYIKTFADQTAYDFAQSSRNNEVVARTAADIAWIDAIFKTATDRGSEGVFLMMQAEPALFASQPTATGNYAKTLADLIAGTPTSNPAGTFANGLVPASEIATLGNDTASRYDEFNSIRKEIYDKAKLFGKQVVIAHGDQHAYTVTHNYLDYTPVPGTPSDPLNLPALPNTHRLENFGSNDTVPAASGAQNWIEVQVECGTDYLFSQRPHHVGSTAASFVPFPSNAPANVPEAPYAVFLVLGGVAVGGAVIMNRRRRALI